MFEARNSMHGWRSVVAVAAVVAGSMALAAQEEDAASGASAHPPVGETATVRANPDDVERVEVTAPQTEALTILEMEAIYDSQELGNKHFRRRNYEEAFPHLLATAKRGFKTSQARLGYMYLHALGGVDYDPIQGIGWLAVAADPETVPWIRRYFNKIWKIVPERFTQDLTAVTEAYKKRYGRGATGVSCNRNRRAGTHQVQLTCLFNDEAFLENGLDREAMRDLWHVTPGPNSHPGVVGLQ
ncbi:MAG: hypothetical protein F4Y86_15850 [Gammaproteobacteria bacterium]|nr:hypothetical protein [Gammaproteobacteria bacterium]MXY53980.1 hypothetical protein [Gammaproteobacteria bacterium]MYB36655.1 hypothetical protein [Gammaproteobacteria bacterium]